MASASSVRAGAAFIEIHADDSQFMRSVKSVHNRMALLGQSLRRVGSQLTAAGAALGVPLIVAAKHAATFEDALLELKASVSDITPDQLKKVREEAIRMSKELGVAPERVAESFTLLVKAGMSVEDALGGAAKSAVEFARVSGVSAHDAANFMKVAMNVFEVSAAQAADTLSAAADASETDIRHMVEAFGLVGSAGKTFDQTLFDISQGFAVLARYGIQGEEAGTGIKVMLQRLVAPSSEAQKALQRVGFSIQNFRDAEGRMLPIVQIVDILAKRLSRVDKITRDQVLDQVFGDRGVRVVGAFLDMGVEGFNNLATSMEHNLPVSEKFRVVMSGLTGIGERLLASLKRLAIALTGSMADGIRVVADGLVAIANSISWLLEKFPLLGKVFGVTAAATFVVGVAMLAVAGAIAAATFTLRTFVGAVGAVTKYGPRILATGRAFGQWAVFIAEMVSAIGAAKTGVMLFEHVFGAWGVFIVEMVRSVGVMETASLLFQHVVSNVLAKLSGFGTLIRPVVAGMGAAVAKLLSTQVAMRALELATLGSGRAMRALRNAMVAVEAIGFSGLAAGAAGSVASWGKGVWTTVKTLGVGGAILAGWRVAVNGIGSAFSRLGGVISKVVARIAGVFGIAMSDGPGPGPMDLLALAAIPAAAYGIYSDLTDPGISGAGQPAGSGPAKNPNVTRTDFRDPMSEPGDGMPSPAFGKSVGTFNADVANRLGIGPEANAVAATATNTARTADATEELVRMGGSPQANADRVPPAANLRAGMAAARNSAMPSAPGGWDREMLSAAERTALAVEAALPILRNILQASRSSSAAFA